MTHHSFPIKKSIMLGGLLILALAGCNFPTRNSAQAPTTAATNTASTINPTIPPLTGKTPVRLPTASAVPQTVSIYLIALQDNGKTGTQVGCGDSAVPVAVEVPATQGVLRAALNKLLSIKDQYYGQSGLYDALYQSDLKVESISIGGGTATIYLTGKLTLGGTCDSPRVQAQLEQTALQFNTVQRAQIFINGVPLKDVLSQK